MSTPIASSTNTESLPCVQHEHRVFALRPAQTQSLCLASSTNTESLPCVQHEHRVFALRPPRTQSLFLRPPCLPRYGAEDGPAVGAVNTVAGECRPPRPPRPRLHPPRPLCRPCFGAEGPTVGGVAGGVASVAGGVATMTGAGICGGCGHTSSSVPSRQNSLISL